MSLDAALLERCCTGTRDETLAALRTFRSMYLSGGPPPPELVQVLRGCATGLTSERGDPTVALLLFYFDVLMYVPAGLRTPGRGPAVPILEALDALAPRLSVLRESEDPLIVSWAWHLLSWLPTPVPGVAEEALDALPRATRSSLRITLAFAGASTSPGREKITSLLHSWLERDSEERDVAAMVLTQLHGDPQRPERTPERAVDALIALANGPRWEDWEAAPAREHGFYADLGRCLVCAGYTRAQRTLPALLHLLDVASAAELEHLLGDLVLKLFYQSHPYVGAASVDALSELQRSTLVALLGKPRVWGPRPRFYAGLEELGLPLGSGPLAAFLGVEAPTSELAVREVTASGALTLSTERAPHELVQSILTDPDEPS